MSAPRSRDEARLQQQIVAWCRNRGIRPIHVANEHVRSKKHAAIAKREGMEPGVADLLILEICPAKPEARGVALELKTPQGRVSESQKKWMARMRKNGWECHVVRDKITAVDILTKLGFGNEGTDNAKTMAGTDDTHD
jgi:hypothetical protein